MQMQSIPKSRVSLVSLAAAFAIFACSSEDHHAVGSDAGPSTEAGAGGAGGAPSTDAGSADCDVTLAPSANDLTTIQTALDTRVKSGNTVCFSKGVYKFTNHVTLSTAQNVTFRGTGSTADDVLLDFTGQTTGKEGISVTTDGFTIMNMSVKNTSGNGITVQANNSALPMASRSAGITPERGPRRRDDERRLRHLSRSSTEHAHRKQRGLRCGGRRHLHRAVQPRRGAPQQVARQCARHRDREHDRRRRSRQRGLRQHDRVLARPLAEPAAEDRDRLPRARQQRARQQPRQHRPGEHARGDGSGRNRRLVLASSHIEITANKIENHSGVAVLIVSFNIIDILPALNGGTPAAPDPTTSRVRITSTFTTTPS